MFAQVICRLAVCHVAVSNGFHKTVFTFCALQNYKNNYELPKSSSLAFVYVFAEKNRVISFKWLIDKGMWIFVPVLSFVVCF